jgi:hypothetical protein
MMFGGYVLALSMALSISGLALLWASTGFLAAVAAVAIYFLVLPLFILPLLTALNLVPPRDGKA